MFGRRKQSVLTHSPLSFLALLSTFPSPHSPLRTMRAGGEGGCPRHLQRGAVSEVCAVSVRGFDVSAPLPSMCIQSARRISDPPTVSHRALPSLATLSSINIAPLSSRPRLPHPFPPCSAYFLCSEVPLSCGSGKLKASCTPSAGIRCVWR
ncbi:hypothetical protein DFH09DRAFT_1158092 [Mycena vulgaris]|nr:hypothetical protein DFH09DRAFT_1158092 [Mycena vulgaris]